MPYEGPFSNRLPANLVRITEMGTSFLIPEEGAPVEEQPQQEGGEGISPISTPAMEVTNSQTPLDPIILDATEDYGKSLSAQITSHPVGDKTDRADHYHVNPITIDISGVISNDKLHIYNWVRNLGQNVLQQTVERLEGIVNKKILVRIEIPDTPVVDNCLITSLSITRDSRLSNGFRVNITAQQITVLTGEITKEPVPDKKDAVQEETNTGSKSPTKAKDVATDGTGGTGGINQSVLSPIGVFSFEDFWNKANTGGVIQ